MNVKIEYLVIIALVVLFVGFVLMNQGKGIEGAVGQDMDIGGIGG